MISEWKRQGRDLLSVALYGKELTPAEKCVEQFFVAAAAGDREALRIYTDSKVELSDGMRKANEVAEQGRSPDGTRLVWAKCGSVEYLLYYQKLEAPLPSTF